VWRMWICTLSSCIFKQIWEFKIGLWPWKLYIDTIGKTVDLRVKNLWFRHQNLETSRTQHASVALERTVFANRQRDLTNKGIYFFNCMSAFRKVLPSQIVTPGVKELAGTISMRWKITQGPGRPGLMSASNFLPGFSGDVSLVRHPQTQRSMWWTQRKKLRAFQLPLYTTLDNLLSCEIAM
jgi:hypothetical protein